MHPTSLENMRTCYDRFVAPAGFENRDEVVVLDIGGSDVNGSYRQIFSEGPYRYLSADIAPGGVDVVLDDPYRIPMANASVDIVLSGQMLEHCERFWLAFQEMVRILKPDGFLFLIAPSSGPIHRYPVDCYRFYPDAYAALARLADCQLAALWRDERGPWQDLVGVFRKTPIPPPPARRQGARSATAAIAFSQGGEANLIRGGSEYLSVLARIHADLQPETYLEIGVRHGRSLALAQCRAIGIDPAPEIDQPLAPGAQVFETTSDEFFGTGTAAGAIPPPDLAFIDGMHLFEFALRDFMHIERVSTTTTLVVVDDIYPNHPLQASRCRETQVWTGDVWKLHRCLAETRPDLFLLPLDTRPTGLLLIAGLDTENRCLWDRYNPLVRHYQDRGPDTPPDHALERRGALDPESPVVAMLCQLLRHLRSGKRNVGEVRNALAALARAIDPCRQ